MCSLTVRLLSLLSNYYWISRFVIFSASALKSTWSWFQCKINSDNHLPVCYLSYMIAYSNYTKATITQILFQFFFLKKASIIDGWWRAEAEHRSFLCCFLAFLVTLFLWSYIFFCLLPSFFCFSLTFSIFCCLFWRLCPHSAPLLHLPPLDGKWVFLSASVLSFSTHAHFPNHCLLISLCLLLIVYFCDMM